MGGAWLRAVSQQAGFVLPGFLRETGGINQIRVAVDDPDAFLAAIIAAAPHGAD